MKRIGKALSFIMCALAVLICVAVIVLSVTDGDGDISDIAWTEEMIEEYNAYPDSFYIEYVKAYEERYFTDDGYFSVSEGRYVPECDQWQFTIRYNKSTLEALSKERGEEMSVDDDHFTFALFASDGTVYRDFLYKKHTEGRHIYYRLIFDGVDISNVDDIKIMIYCIDDIEGGELPKLAVGRLPLFDVGLPREDYNYKKELPADLKPSSGFRSGKELLKG